MQIVTRETRIHNNPIIFACNLIKRREANYRGAKKCLAKEKDGGILGLNVSDSGRDPPESISETRYVSSSICDVVLLPKL